MPAPIGNMNALKTGCRTARYGFVLPRLGMKCPQAYADVLRMRRGVETLVRRQYGGVTLTQAARIQSLCRLEMSCRIAEQSIKENPSMTPEELRAQRACITQWSAQRDNALVALLGDAAGKVDPWSALDRPLQRTELPGTMDDAMAVQGGKDETDASVESLEGRK